MDNQRMAESLEARETNMNLDLGMVMMRVETVTVMETKMKEGMEMEITMRMIERFQELTMFCTKMVLEEEDRVEKFIGCLLKYIQRNVIATEPTRLQDAVHIANNMMDQKLKGGSLCRMIFVYLTSQSAWIASTADNSKYFLSLVTPSSSTEGQRRGPCSTDSRIILSCCRLSIYNSILLFQESYMSFSRMEGRSVPAGVTRLVPAESLDGFLLESLDWFLLELLDRSVPAGVTRSVPAGVTRSVPAEALDRLDLNLFIGNISYLTDLKEFDGGYVAFGGGAKGGKIIGKRIIRTGPRKNNMYSVDMKNIVHKKDLTCVATKATNDESMLFHRRLSHINFKNINELAKENLVTGIKREYNVTRTPQQNRVAERRNRTLIEEARTMLTESELPITFWTEAIKTACYVQNKVLVVNPLFKTLYELFRDRTPALSFMRPFGCHVTIHNTLDHLGKFDGKSDEGFFVGYSTNSKAFRVYNTRTRKVEENLHINFLKNKLGSDTTYGSETMMDSLAFKSMLP
nr:ribonuclease H-like domain-containing protein [Tanacetum cinerariifolium]